MITLATIVALASVIALLIDCVRNREQAPTSTMNMAHARTYADWREIELRLNADSVRVSVAGNGARRVSYPLAFRGGRGSTFLPSSIHTRAQLIAYVGENCYPECPGVWHDANCQLGAVNRHPVSASIYAGLRGLVTFCADQVTQIVTSQGAHPHSKRLTRVQ